MSTASKKAKKASKQPDASALYRREGAQFDLEDQEFSTTLWRPSTRKFLDNASIAITAISWEWEEGNPTLTGSVEFTDAGFDKFVAAREGDVLTLKVKYQGKTTVLWKMRLRTESLKLAGNRSYELADDSIILQESTDKFRYVKNKAHPKGWLAHEIAIDVCRRYKISVGKVARSTHRISALSGDMSPMEAIQKAYNMDRAATGRRYVARWTSGKLEIVPLQRNSLLYRLGPLLEDATVTREERDEDFANAITAKARVKSGKRKGKQLTYEYMDRPSILKEGYVHKNVTAHNINDMSDLRKWAKRYVLRHSRRKRIVRDVSHRGIAFIRRGDACRVSIPEYGLTNERSYCFVSSGAWSLSGGDFTMSLNLTFDDPYKNSAADEKARAAKRKLRTKKK